MFGRSQRQDADDLRAKFLANKEQVRSWISDWVCPEIGWEEFPEVPAPWAVARGKEQQWLKRDAPFISAYDWFLAARPLARGITHVTAHWRFGEGHTFELLEIEFRSVADPEYLAETLTWGVDAAALKGWREEDVHELHAWLFELLDARPMNQMVSGKKRTGFILFHLIRTPISTTEIAARLSITLTDTALDGSPLQV